MRTSRSMTGFLALLCIALLVAAPAAAQKRGGTLRLYHNDNPPSTSLHEEATIASVTPFAAVFNNLVAFDPFKVHETHRHRGAGSRRKLVVGSDQYQARPSSCGRASNGMTARRSRPRTCSAPGG